MSGTQTIFENNLEEFPSLDQALTLSSPNVRPEKRKQKSPENLSTPDSACSSSGGSRPTTKREKKFRTSQTYTVGQLRSGNFEDISDDSLESISTDKSTMKSPQDFAKMTSKEKDEEYRRIYSLMEEKENELKDVKRRMDMIDKTNFNLSETNRNLSEKMNSDANKSNDTEGIFEKMTRYQNHMKEKEDKKTNIVVYGVPEPSEDEKVQDADDEKFVKEALSVVGCDDESKIERVFRIGKKKNFDGTMRKFPRVMKVFLADEDIKNTLLWKQGKIKENVELFRGQEYSQYMREDMTSWELEIHREMAKTRNERNANLKEGEEKWKVFRNKLVQGNVKT